MTQEMTLFLRAWTQGTEEHSNRIRFPGDINTCQTEECINNYEKLYKVRYWLCEECTEKVPDSRTFNVHAPSTNILSKKNRKTQSAYAFIAFLKNK